MNKKIVGLLILGSLSFAAQAKNIVCNRVIEIEGMPFVYKIAPKIETRIPNIKINTASGELIYTKQVHHGQRVSVKEKYQVVPPNEEFETRSLVFKTDIGETILNASQPERGRYYGSSVRYIIAELYEGDIDASAWTYLCPIRIKSLLRLE